MAEISNAIWEYVGVGIDFLLGYITEQNLLTITLALVVLVFIIILIVKQMSYFNKFNRGLKHTNKALKKLDKLDESNIAMFEKNFIAYFNKPVKFGWDCYKKNRCGYPSDYITQYDCVEVPSIKYKKRKALIGYGALLLFLAVFARSMGVFLEITEIEIYKILFAPIIFGIIFLYILSCIYDNSDIKLQKRFIDFQTLLDTKVDLFEKQTVPFKSLNASVKGEISNEERNVNDEAQSKLDIFVAKIDALCASDSSIETIRDIRTKVIGKIARSAIADNDKIILKNCIAKLEEAIVTRDKI